MPSRLGSMTVTLVAAGLAGCLSTGQSPKRTCFPVTGLSQSNPGVAMMTQPLLSREEVDTLGMYGGWLYLRPNTDLPEHQHDDGDELIWISCGRGQITIEGKTIPIAEGISHLIRKGTPHHIVAEEEGLGVVQVFRPGTPGQRYYR